MEATSWCDQRNLPCPDGRVLPLETAIYIAIAAIRAPTTVPDALHVYLSYLFGLTPAEA
jgi:hypothetical protein